RGETYSKWRMRAGHQGFGDGRSTIAFRISAVELNTPERRKTQCGLRRQMVAIGVCAATIQSVLVVTQRRNEFEPCRVIGLQLNEPTRYGALAVRRQHAAVSVRILVVHLVLEEIAAVG